MRIGPTNRLSEDLRITHWDPTGNILTIDLTWAEWETLVADANHVRATGRFRDTVCS